MSLVQLINLMALALVIVGVVQLVRAHIHRGRTTRVMRTLDKTIAVKIREKRIDGVFCIGIGMAIFFAF